MKTFVYSVISLLAGTCIGSYFADNQHIYRTSSTIQTDTLRLMRVDTVLLRDTLRISIPAYRATASPRTVTTTHGDSDSISLQAVQRVYSDSTFRAVVSGIDPRLDSLTIYPRLPIITMTDTRHIHTSEGAVRTTVAPARTLIAAKPSRWGLGITAGATATSHGLTPGITLGLTYRLWP